MLRHKLCSGKLRHPGCPGKLRHSGCSGTLRHAPGPGSLLRHKPCSGKLKHQGCSGRLRGTLRHTPGPGSLLRQKPCSGKLRHPCCSGVIWHAPACAVLRQAPAVPRRPGMSDAPAICTQLRHTTPSGIPANRLTCKPHGPATRPNVWSGLFWHPPASAVLRHAFRSISGMRTAPANRL